MNDELKLPTALDTLPLDKETAEIAQQIISEQDFEKLKDLTKLFNVTAAKKNTLRVIKLSNLLDKVSDQMLERFENQPDMFSNKDLLDYMTVTQNAITRASDSLSRIDETPLIQVNQQKNEINVTVNDGLSNMSRESKTKIVDAVKALLSQARSLDVIENSDTESVIDIEENIHGEN